LRREVIIMMRSPESYVDDLKDKPYEDLIKEKDKLIKNIQRFENNQIADLEFYINPSPEVIYQCNLLYLSELCKLVHDKFNKKL
jgi:hypothetical protein